MFPSGAASAYRMRPRFPPFATALAGTTVTIGAAMACAPFRWRDRRASRDHVEGFPELREQPIPGRGLQHLIVAEEGRAQRDAARGDDVAAVVEDVVEQIDGVKRLASTRTW